MIDLNPKTVTAYIGLGSNLGDSIGQLLAATEALHALPHTDQVAISGFYKTAPVDADGPDYLNAVAAIQTRLAPHALLKQLFSIEADLGRERSYTNAPRTLDLDLLLYGDEIIQDDELTLPHPRMHLRAFVLAPLAELVPHLKLAQGSLSELLAACQDQTIQPLDAELD